MSRPGYVDISSGNQGWDGPIDDNFDIAGSAPIPIYENATLTESNLTGTFPPAQYDRCFVWVNHSVVGYTLYWSDGASWSPYGEDRRPVRSSAVTISQLITDKFVRFTGAGTVTYNFLAASLWKGRMVTVRNDTSGNVTLDPSGAETINGAATKTVAAGSTAVIYNDGTALFAFLGT